MENEKFDIDAFRAQPLPTEDEIMANWQGDIKEPVVSIICQTYNQADYIENTLKGFLTQKTNFPFEIIVNDDCSTDETLRIIKEYKANYPKLFKVIEHNRNMFSLGVRPINFTLPLARGEFICLCEGDDFWFKDNKLTLHVDFLRANPSYSLHVTDALEVDKSMQILSSSKLNRLKVKNGKLNKEDLFKFFVLLPLSSCFKNDFNLPFPRYYNKSINGDNILQYELAHSGAAYIERTVTSLYLHHKGGIWSQQVEIVKTFEEAHTHLVLAQASLNRSDEKEHAQRRLINMIFSLVKLIGWRDFFKAFILKLFKKYNHMI